MNRIKLIALLLCLNQTLTAREKHCTEHTFAIIKPGAVQENQSDEILEMIKKAGFIIIAMKKMKLTSADVRNLYREYKRRSWFAKYVQEMTASPAIVMILQKHNCVKEWDTYKKIIRAVYDSIHNTNNVVHGSDSIKSAKREIAIFFKD